MRRFCSRPPMSVSMSAFSRSVPARCISTALIGAGLALCASLSGCADPGRSEVSSVAVVTTTAVVVVPPSGGVQTSASAASASESATTASPVSESAAYAGTWVGHTRHMTLASNGTGAMSVFSGAAEARNGHCNGTPPQRAS